MVYQVYINWPKQTEQYHGRLILVFPNRQYADEFYNFAIKPGKDYVWKTLTRQSPQFWSWNDDPENLPWLLGRTNPNERPTYMACRIGGYDAQYNGGMPVINPDPTGDTEYKSGRSFYIRTKATPHMYWFYDGSNSITVSSTKRSKFQIDRTNTEDSADVDGRHVLERKDRIRITAHSLKSSSPVGLFQNYAWTNSAASDFDFRSFYNGDFSVSWTNVDGVEAYVAYRPSYTGDVWELVD